ncbi:MAG: hypothetical protein JSU98_14050 [Gemmatimonadales bacterium]|nr:MAG: hypothetical protein JSU98_14050 [Gemmatimonadales bacterium]
MSLVPRRGRGDPPLQDTATLVEGVHEEAVRQAWEADSARWRAGALAEAIFGEGVVPRLRSARGAAGFRALVELEVPFTNLAHHAELERRFLWEAYRDEILARVPTLFVFTPAPRAVVGGPAR